MEPEDAKKDEPKLEDVNVTMRIDTQSPATVEQRKVCEACYWKGRAEGAISAMVCLIITIVLLKTFFHVTE